MLILAFFVLLAAIILLWQANRQQQLAGLPGGRIIYADTRAWGPVEKPLFSAEIGLTGKPDYLVQHKKALIPVEVKSSRPPEAPYDAHIYQVAAYCLLVQQVHGIRPPYGILHYRSSSGSSRTFAIDYTPALETAVRSVLAEMQSHPRKSNDRSHDIPARCSRCGYRSLCDQALHE